MMTGRALRHTMRRALPAVGPALVLLLLWGCRRPATPSFSRPTPAVPDTADCMVLPLSLGYVSDGDAAERGSAMLARYNAMCERTVKPADCIWRPAAPGGRDTLWLKLGTDVYVCAVQQPRPDFSAPGATPPDTAGARWITVRLAVPADGDLQTRGERLWERLVVLSGGFYTTEPTAFHWLPATGDADDTLRLRTADVGVTAVGVRHAGAGAGLTSRDDFMAAIGVVAPYDVAGESAPTLKERLFYPKSGRPRPVAYVWGVALLLLTVGTAAGVVVLLHRRRHVRSQRIGDTAAPDAALQLHVLMQAPAVRRLHELAAKGDAATADDWNALIDAVDAALPDFQPALRRLCPDLAEKEWRVCLLVKLRFTPSEAACLLACTKQSVANVRRHLHAKCFGEDGSTRAFDARLRDL